MKFAIPLGAALLLSGASYADTISPEILNQDQQVLIAAVRHFITDMNELYKENAALKEENAKLKANAEPKK